MRTPNCLAFLNVANRFLRLSHGHYHFKKIIESLPPGSIYLLDSHIIYIATFTRNHAKDPLRSTLTTQHIWQIIQSDRVASRVSPNIWWIFC